MLTMKRSFRCAAWTRPPAPETSPCVHTSSHSLPLSASPVSSPHRLQVPAVHPEVVPAPAEVAAEVVEAAEVAATEVLAAAEVAPTEVLAAAEVAPTPAEATQVEVAATEAGAATELAVTVSGVIPAKVLTALTASWAMSLPVWGVGALARRRETGTSPPKPPS